MFHKMNHFSFIVLIGFFLNKHFMKVIGSYLKGLRYVHFYRLGNETIIWRESLVPQTRGS
jgi:hypothetical protein